MSRFAGPALPLTSEMRSPSMATSPVEAGLPVPSTMVPPRMTVSCMGAVSLVSFGSNKRPVGRGGQARCRCRYSITMPWTSAGHGSFANASSTALSLRLIHPAACLSAQQPHPGEFMRRIALGLFVTTAISGPVLAAPIQTVFVVGMENHNLTQPGSFTSIQQILGNSAAPYLNSLITPGNQNAKYTSYTTQMTNVAPGVHPSEPNYI